MISKRIFNIVGGRVLLAALVAVQTAGLFSCTKSTADGERYFRLENPVLPNELSNFVSAHSLLGFEAIAVIGDPTKELVRYDIRSNGSWTAECNSVDGDWIKIYPTRGQGDGRVIFCLDDNAATTSRAATVVFRYDDGRDTESTIVVTQGANVPYIKFFVENLPADKIVAGRAAASYGIRVVSNVEPFYEATGIADWATLTETGNGTMKLDVEAYPLDPSALERVGKISFKGSGQWAEVEANLDIVQTIVPKIELKGNDVDQISEVEMRIELPAYQPAPVTFTVRANWDWQIETPEGAWFTVNPSAGEAGKEYKVTVVVNNNISLTPRTEVFTISTEQVVGTRHTVAVQVSQEGLAERPPMEGLTSPVKWFFDGMAEKKDYTKQKQQFEIDNKLEAYSGVGYLSFHHHFIVNGALHPKCTRVIGGTGQPYITGVWPGDYWEFEVPVKNFRSGTKVRFRGEDRISGTGQKYWRLEYLDGTNWKPVGTPQTAVVGGVQITYTRESDTKNKKIDETMTFMRRIDDGSVKIRYTCVANTMGGAEPNGGTHRWVGPEEETPADSPSIEVVE